LVYNGILSCRCFVANDILDLPKYDSRRDWR